ncbi:MAG: Crp/Fnr family transcriptional regulator [Bdellovibrionota bacterium]
MSKFPNKSQRGCKQCEIRGTNIFCGLPDEALALIEQNKITNHFKRGQFIFYAGNTPGGIYCINSGVVKLETEGSGGNGHILRVVQGGGILGYRSLFAEESYDAAAVVHEDAEVCFIPKSSLLALIGMYPDVGIKLLALASKELRHAEDRLCAQSDKIASERVASAVIFLRENFPTQNWTRKEIAEWAGTTSETVIRTLADFESEGLIEQKGRTIHIKDKSALVQAADLVH